MTRKKEEMISRDQAKLVLENVFNACSVPTNSVPMEMLEDNIRHNRFITLLTRFLAAVALICVLALPFLYTGANVTVAAGTMSGNAMEVIVNVASLMPVKEASFTLDGDSLDYTKNGNAYHIQVDRNGTLETRVVTMNNRETTTETEITAFAETPPEIVSHSLEGKVFTLVVQTGSYPVAFEEIYGLNEEGERVYPDSWEESTGTVTFKNVNSVHNFFIPDSKGNVLQAIFTPRDGRE